MKRVALRGLVVYLITSSIVLCGAFLGSLAANRPFLRSLARSDALRYIEVASTGYSYDPDDRSSVAYFPVFPLAGRIVGYLAGSEPLTSLLVVSNAFLTGSFILLGVYVASSGRLGSGSHSRAARLPVRDGTIGEPIRQGCLNARGARSDRLLLYTLLLFGILPFTFFFRMPYSESTFLFFCILSFCAIQRRWPLPATALLVGIGSACRPVGVALLPPFLLHVWERSESRLQGTLHCLGLFPLASWGLVSFLVFQYLRFGEPLAFAKTQEHWALQVSASAREKWLALASWEPIWSTYAPAFAWCYWKNWPPAFALFNCQFMNPVCFVATSVLIIIGAWRRWLSSKEVLLSVGILAISYIAKAYESGMNSQARYASAVFPAYLVAGELLQRMPASIAITILAVSGGLVATYAALFAAGYPFF
jgi:hypothetical protein